MQAIETRYLGATNTRGSRIKATAASGVSVAVWHGDEFNSEEAHWQAAKVLAESLGWFGAWVAGSTRKGYVFVRQFARSGETPYTVERP